MVDCDWQWRRRGSSCAPPIAFRRQPGNRLRQEGSSVYELRTSRARARSEMDARVKGRFGLALVSTHGGGAGAGRPARRQRRLVTLRCAGRDRMTVSGRELPRTSGASLRNVVRDRIDQAEVPHRVGAGRRAPACIAQLLPQAARITSFGCSCRGCRVIAAQRKPQSSRATATVAMFGSLPLPVRCR